MVIGIIVIVIALLMLMLSGYIRSQVSEGRGKIKNAQETVDQSKRLFSLTEPTEQVGDVLTDSAQNEIDAGRLKAEKYSKIATTLQFAGIFCVILGGVVIWIGMRRRKKE